MKKIFTMLTGAAIVAALTTSCNNAEEVKKQTDEQNTKIQTLVDEKLNGLQAQADLECTATIDSLAQVKYDEWYATEGKKTGAKPKPKPTPKKEEPKKTEPVDPQKDRKGTGDVIKDQKQRNDDPTKTPVENQKKRN